MSLSWMVLASRRSINLSEVRMSSTYAGMIVGQPSKHANDSIIRRRVRAAEEAYPDLPVHLVPPVIEYPDLLPGALGRVEMLPAVACIGVFESGAIDPANDDGWTFSALAVVWFQPTPDLPSGESVDPAALRDIAWDELARDYEH
ncbi:hypothetical protein [Streptomyces sp. 6N223]|uniref:hypothetical protein n=1 Tax=Streptomyces sp. 6N223 TaxID=3457412 RepID=UPI003FD6696D